jgi:hypothetical protein
MKEEDILDSHDDTKLLREWAEMQRINPNAAIFPVVGDDALDFSVIINAIKNAGHG